MMYGIGWYGENASIAQTGYEFDEATGLRLAREGSEAADFWQWVKAQSFDVDELTDGLDLPVVRADLETPDEEWLAWPLN